MEVMQLRVFLVVAECENMTEAANKLNVVQPSVSRMIRRLEEELGEPIFDRVGRGIKLNEGGRILASEAKKILSAMDQLSGMVAAANRQGNNIQLKVEAGSALIPEILHRYGLIYPKVQVTATQEKNHVTGGLRLYTANHKEIAEGDAIARHVVTEKVDLLIPKGLVTKENRIISIKDLNVLPFVGLRKGLAFRDMTDAFLDRMGIRPDYIFESDNPSMVRSVMERGQGVAFYPESSWGNMDLEAFYICDLGEGGLSRSIWLEVETSLVGREEVEKLCDLIIGRFNEKTAPPILTKKLVYY